MRNSATDIGTLLPGFSKAQPVRQGPSRAVSGSPSSVKFEPENVRDGLAQLVLTLVELIRQLLERQALRRIDAGGLTDEEIERLGQTFLRLAEEVEKLKRYFGFRDEDLNLDLGPLGKLH